MRPAKGDVVCCVPHRLVGKYDEVRHVVHRTRRPVSCARTTPSAGAGANGLLQPPATGSFPRERTCSAPGTIRYSHTIPRFAWDWI